MRNIGIRAGMSMAGLSNPRGPRRGSALSVLGGLFGLLVVAMTFPGPVIGILAAVMLVGFLSGRAQR